MGPASDGKSSHCGLVIGGHVGQSTFQNFRELTEPAIIAWREPDVIGCAANSSKKLPRSNLKTEIIVRAARASLQ
jgi:hypothetical protein